MASDFTYNYYSGTNRLQNLNGGADYQYDEIGNLVADPSQNVTSIDWTPYGKVRQVTKGDGTVVNFKYDGSGNRIAKSTTTGGTTTTTRYIRDASGNVMAMYEEDALKSQPIYGSSRLGMYKGGNLVGERNLGNKLYELTNHLGNVLAVVTDNINMADDLTTATVVSATDYYPFGLEMAGRTFSALNYAYGFNGKRKDDNGEFGDTHYDYGFRIYNPEIGKFLSTDPLSVKYPYYSPYQYAGNSPIKFIDIDGLEPTEARLQWKSAPKLREAQGNPAKQIFYQTSGLGGDGKYMPKMYVYEDYSEGTSKFFWYNDLAQQWSQFDPNKLVSSEEVERVALTSIGIAGIGVAGGSRAGTYLMLEVIEGIVEELSGIPWIPINPDPTDIADPAINRAARRVLNPLQSHHLISESLESVPIIAKAKKGNWKYRFKDLEAFRKSNGFGSHAKHPKYTDQIRNHLSEYDINDFSEGEAANLMRQLEDYIDKRIGSNPDVKLNDLNLELDKFVFKGP